jgi:hypothetical protein
MRRINGGQYLSTPEYCECGEPMEGEDWGEGRYRGWLTCHHCREELCRGCGANIHAGECSLLVVADDPRRHPGASGMSIIPG